ncbi:YdcF family protein [Rathayibacter rathayi]|uniref:YdcF family protein n=2 Tax=Rathayibacter rathayi TaxID=33887 RepID=A0ABD6W796_RATRA|nr:YdcF family protein [Rathayibacter rathayi]PPG41913.1 YdcF family protein [Rathayibacter rathayi]PPH77676.1 YdcF family protein [Rathayibacter rathayi]PPI57933.1 YdcF family protein [Rathayibacter rathayi]PPI66538.1 YdcF family protein [Rathayibacter rathayi]
MKGGSDSGEDAMDPAMTNDRPSTLPSPERQGRRRARTLIARLLLVPLVVLAVFGAGIPLYVTPPIDPIPEQADAVFVLGPSTRARVEFARRIITSGATDTMVLSVGPGEMGAPYEDKKYKKCNEPGGDVLCYSADPLTTQGEARQLRDLAAEYGWDHVIVITSSPHLVRAKMILQRCYSGDLSMVPSGEPMGLDYLVGQYFYQTGGFLKAFLVTNNC